MIKLLVSMASQEKSYTPGEVISLDSATEKRLIDTGQAEKVATKKKVVKK